jgi:hypothetical protein
MWLLLFIVAGVPHVLLQQELSQSLELMLPPAAEAAVLLRLLPASGVPYSVCCWQHTTHAPQVPSDSMT